MTNAKQPEQLVIEGWYFLGKPDKFEPIWMRKAFIPDCYIRSIKRFCRDDVAIDKSFQRYVGSFLASTAVVAAFDLKKGSLIPFFIERQKAIDLQLI